MMMNILFSVPIYQRCSLVMIYDQSFLDCLFIVISTSTFFTSQHQALHKFVLWNVKFYHCSHFVTAFTEHLFQSLRLRYCTWETIKNDTFMITSETIVDTGQNINHQVIGY